MSGGAIIGAAAIGAGSSYIASKSASKASSQQAQAAAKSGEVQVALGYDQLEFQKEQFERWEEVFGPISDNLGSYYKELKPDSYAAQGIGNLQQTYQTSKQNLEKQLATRGLSDSGAAVQGYTDLERTRMLGEAEIRTKAEDVVSQQQAGFLGLGLGQQNALQQGVSGAYSNLMGETGTQASNALAASSSYNQQAAQAMSGVGQSIGQGVSTYMTHNALQPQKQPNYASGSVTQYPSIFNS